MMELGLMGLALLFGAVGGFLINEKMSESEREEVLKMYDHLSDLLQSKEEQIEGKEVEIALLKVENTKLGAEIADLKEKLNSHSCTALTKEYNELMVDLDSFMKEQPKKSKKTKPKKKRGKRG